MSRLGFGGITALAVVTLLVLYPEVWGVHPSVDDYMPPLAAVHRGMERGPWSLFVEPSSYPFYRPLTFLSVWLAGTLSMEAIVPLVHGLHFFWVAACLGVLALWAGTLAFSRLAFAATALVFVTHPVLAGPLASIDGFQRIAATAWTWFGAWFVLRSPRGALTGDLAAAGCLALGLGFAEYALGLVPLALLVALWRYQDGRPLLATVRLALLLGLVVAGWYLLRGEVLGARSAMFLTIAPHEWVLHAVQLLGVTLFWGNTTWTMLGPQPFAKVVTGGVIVLALAWLAAGLSRAEPSRPATLRGWLARPDTGLLIPALGAATFPMFIMGHVSEMYSTPVLMAVALLAGRAASGWLAASQPFRRPALAAAVVAMGIGVVTDWSKISGLAAAGRRTDDHIDQILRHVPSDASGWHIATVFDHAPQEPRYSVFQPWRGPWDVVRADTIYWLRPQQELDFERLFLPAACTRAGEAFDLLLVWEPAADRFRPLEEGLAGVCRGR